MSLGSEFDTALADIGSLVGLSTVTIGATGYACVRSSRRNSKDMQEVGYLNGYDHEILIRGSVLGVANVPAVNDSVTLNSQTCRVVEVIEPNVANGSDKVFYKLRLKVVI